MSQQPTNDGLAAATEARHVATNQQQQSRCNSIKSEFQLCDNQLNSAKLELIRYNEEVKDWSRNVDQNYAWVVLGSIWIILAGVLGPYRMYGYIFAYVTESGEFTRGEATKPVATIITVESIVGPLIPLVIAKISARWCICLGGLLIALGNGLAGMSRSLTLDIMFIGVVQGIGYACIFVPHMDVINSYFSKYRSLAMGLSLTGGTMAVFVLSPYTEWLLTTFPWRCSYYGLSAVCLVTAFAGLLIKPNPKPIQPDVTIPPLSCAKDTKKQFDLEGGNKGGKQVATKTTHSSIASDMLAILKLPAFHMIWFSEVLYFWIFSIYCLIAVDYGMDRGCTKEEADTLLGFQSTGELVGRLILPVIVDLRLVAPRHTVVLVLLICASLLFLTTQVMGYLWSAAITMVIMAFCALLYILLNSLLVEYVGERNVTLGYGMASFICGILMAARPVVIGYFRDDLGSYNPLMVWLAGFCALAALLWLIEPVISRCLVCKESVSRASTPPPQQQQQPSANGKKQIEMVTK